MAHRVALLLAAALALSPAFLRPILEAPPAPRACEPVGQGRPPRGWLGCAADGPGRPLTGEEALISGLPVDLNRATARDLAFVPGLSESLGRAIVAEREARGPFASVEEVVRVRGIGPGRLAKARSHLAVTPRR